MIDEYKFKPGDKVITSLGETGIITRICKCDRCKARGFYEPVVLCDEESDYIDITDSDFKNGFKSFYRIGDYIFGNINFDALHKEEESILDELELIKKHIANLKNAIGEKEE